MAPKNDKKSNKSSNNTSIPKILKRTIAKPNSNATSHSTSMNSQDTSNVIIPIATPMDTSTYIWTEQNMMDSMVLSYNNIPENQRIPIIFKTLGNQAKAIDNLTKIVQNLQQDVYKLALRYEPPSNINVSKYSWSTIEVKEAIKSTVKDFRRSDILSKDNINKCTMKLVGKATKDANAILFANRRIMGFCRDQRSNEVRRVQKIIKKYYKPQYREGRFKSLKDIEKVLVILRSKTTENQKLAGRILGIISQLAWKSENYNPTEKEYTWLQDLIIATLDRDRLKLITTSQKNTKKTTGKKNIEDIDM